MTAPRFATPGYPMSKLTTVGTGGPARWFAKPRTVDELRELLAWAAAGQLDLAVIGLGSNLLVADAGYDGVAVRLAGDLAAVAREGEGRIRAGGGASLAVVVRRATEWGLSGVEFGCAIPGTAGGAVRMNAGAYGGELRDVLAEALVVSAAGERRGGPEQLAMRYRGSNVAEGEVVAEAVLDLVPADPAQIRATVRQMQDQRRAAQPQKVRTFGSVWQNPGGELTAGQLLERCELKGFTVGGARISPVHANFIENLGGARSADVVALMAEARDRARARFGVELHHEVQMLGPIAL